MKVSDKIITAVLIVVILGLGYFIYSREHTARQQQIAAALLASQNSSQPSATATPVPTPTPTPTKTAAQQNLSYNQAVQTYGASGYRFQFSACHGIPGSLNIKQGAKFMLDNRDGGAHRIVVKSQTFNLAGYGFAIVTAKDLGTYNITCDGGGAAQLTVEK